MYCGNFLHNKSVCGDINFWNLIVFGFDRQYVGRNFQRIFFSTEHSSIRWNSTQSLLGLQNVHNVFSRGTLTQSLLNVGPACPVSIQPSSVLHAGGSACTFSVARCCRQGGGGPRVVASTAAFHARVRGSVPGLGGLKETKMFLPIHV